ncbi:MAG: hypothetical protein J0I28_02515 [Caulobacterales bacterium]|nr:hypothetical protein [Caulobacterales bacterium]
MLGPFQGLEESFGLSDKAAHALAFYATTLGLFLAAPRMRRMDLALGVLGFGLVMEGLQGVAGRDISLWDFAADAAGVAAAVAPGMVERLRHHVRTNPYMTFAEIGARDRRRGRRKPATVKVVEGVRAQA